MITAVQVDDEASAREFLRGRLQDVAPDVQILGEAKNINEAARLIADTKPQLIFLDVQMRAAMASSCSSASAGGTSMWSSRPVTSTTRYRPFGDRARNGVRLEISRRSSAVLRNAECEMREEEVQRMLRA